MELGCADGGIRQIWIWCLAETEHIGPEATHRPVETHPAPISSVKALYKPVRILINAPLLICEGQRYPTHTEVAVAATLLLFAFGFPVNRDIFSGNASTTHRLVSSSLISSNQIWKLGDWSRFSVSSPA